MPESSRQGWRPCSPDAGNPCRYDDCTKAICVVKSFFATCPKGLEYLLVDELKTLGAADVREALAGVHFTGELDVGYRACLWSRLASRVLMTLAEFDVPDADALYAGARAIGWSEHLGLTTSFAVDAVGATPGVTHSQYAALRVKDAIVDAFREATGERPNVDTENPGLRVNLVLRRGRAIISLNLSGAPLHQRGYRKGAGLAPLKENLAAAMLLRANWPTIYAAGGGLVDPLCGSGTLPIEAALMAADVAPGLRRAHRGFTGWRGHDAALWKMLHDAAQARAQAGLQALRPVFFGFDENPTVLNEARRNAQEALLSGFIQLGRQTLEHLHRPHELEQPGLVITNPPYGERMGDDEDVIALYRLLGEKLKAEFPGWRASVIAADETHGHALGLRADKRYKLYNGAIECTLLNFDIAAADAPKPEPKPLSPGAQMVKNRIEKNFRHLRKQAQREGVECWRVYDADLPEYAAAIDIYRSIEAGEHLHIQEYAAPASVDENLARTRWRELVRAAAEALDIPRERIALKQRRRGKGGEKYGRLDERGEFIEVSEGGLKFLVNLRDYLDTGLFLDHRPLRARVRELTRGKRFLNLFCYTGSVSVYAAAGDASETTSVDLSQTYLDWAARNLALNGFDSPAHKLVREDAVDFLRSRSAMYDLIFVDPPTFSNSKRAEDFDVQRDHVRLLHLCAERLLPGGLILFSNNFRRFKLDQAALAGFAIREISAQTIPFDFARSPRIHRAWELKKT
ncbi:MAG: bifunctional 23S rRNA (guanine(2069)-N(7))-methyltransferase RlmK/23S rRNA (guanine(2445)-N(2))-methyltransferase RlmL [Xanthomonadaceae bacterium]|nr:bifunctional 23S rRNA (guanine(2069)-N(7))-methyltransferase RlmK/23S rRNA (guanine(2445)-N(2))-methyltransferase RlmL [Xanthomonadaceae bacterium]MDE1960363.1 bifunctional 23S rRNA (guanine(2069)-N(7))-methyltransferase RlmK/23S rRNA (guanine(2445)-N(2))-methyltransferase RlmL [Xanthomonadaceae bacterium]MDE2083243.1 bifunctional 23S rRNA (guanine(2069)-N(7))-methyltransferase RlmK/23S rRNA (guanine(2445)-N(2))-methyltransferase RlmL [Xanthomonadaceae bacterium]